MPQTAAMPTVQPASPASVALYDARPFFEKALQFGVQHGILDRARIDAICADAPKGMVQIARYFGNEFLRPDLEKAKDRIVNLVSLHLESSSGGNLQQAAEMLRDHTFMSRSKAGSDMLRAMLALPENSSFEPAMETGDAAAYDARRKLADWTLESLANYQRELARRLPLQHEKEAARWLAQHFDMDAGELENTHSHAEAVIRTALLRVATQGTDMPDWPGFEKMVLALRKKCPPAKTGRAAPGGKAAGARKLPALVMPEGMPETFNAVVHRLRQSVVADLPLILDASQSPRTLFTMEDGDHNPPLLGRYFWLEDLANELDHHERAISGAWDKATGGNCDDGSLLTLFVCVAAGAAPKTLLSEKAATALVRKIQKPGTAKSFDAAAGRQYILDHAPVQHQPDYLELWAGFLEEALPILQNDSSYALQDALALLHRECNVK